MSNTTRRNPTRLSSNVLYHHNGRTVRLLAAKPNEDAALVKHHSERFECKKSELFVATSDECKEYLKPVAA